MIITAGATGSGGSGGGDVNLTEVGGVAISLGQTTMAGSIPVTIASDQPGLGGQTDAEARATQTNSGILDGNGDTVVLALNGAVAASALFPDAGTFDGTIVFEVSTDGGTEYNSVQANARSDFGPSGSGINPSNIEWVFALGGGETHARVRVTAYTAGSSTVTLTGTYSQNAAIQNAMFTAAGGNIPRAAVLVGGRFDSGSVHVPKVRTDDDGKNDMAWVVRDMSGTFRVDGAMTGANDFGKAIGGIDDGNVYQFGEMRDADPASGTTGLVVRNIPKQSPTATTTQVADSASSVQILAANTSRLGATIFNDSTAALYVKMGTTASATDYTIRLIQYEYFKVPFGYTGRIDGIWASDPGDGAARITEFT